MKVIKCKDCIYLKCLMRRDKEFHVCPVQVAKEKSEKVTKS